MDLEKEINLQFDKLNSIYQLFGPPIRYSVTLYYTGDTKKLHVRSIFDTYRFAYDFSPTHSRYSNAMTSFPVPKIILKKLTTATPVSRSGRYISINTATTTLSLLSHFSYHCLILPLHANDTRDVRYDIVRECFNYLQANSSSCLLDNYHASGTKLVYRTS